MANTKNFTTEEKLEVIGQKIESAVNNIADSFSTAFAEIKAKMPAIRKECKDWTKMARRRLTNFCYACFDFAVKSSIILIALMMLYEFSIENPAMWTNCISMVSHVCNSVKSAAIDTYEGCMNMCQTLVDTVFWFIR